MNQHYEIRLLPRKEYSKVVVLKKRTRSSVALSMSEMIAPEEATNESLSEPQILFATQSPTIATEGLAEQKASSSAATPIEECGDMTAGHDQHTPPAECEGPNTCTPAEVKNAAAVTNLEITSGAVTPFMLSEAEAMSTQSESKELRTDGDSTKLDAQADVESTVVTTKVQAPLNSAAAVIGSEVAAVPAQPKNNVVCFSGRRRRLLRPLAASAAACLALWAGLILTNPDALATLASLGRVASDR